MMWNVNELRLKCYIIVLWLVQDLLEFKTYFYKWYHIGIPYIGAFQMVLIYDQSLYIEFLNWTHRRSFFSIMLVVTMELWFDPSFLCNTGDVFPGHYPSGDVDWACLMSTDSERTQYGVRFRWSLVWVLRQVLSNSWRSSIPNIWHVFSLRLISCNKTLKL